jgi:hypothetical protein
MGTDRLRFELGDTLEADAMFHDEELTILLGEQPTFKKAKAQAAETLATNYAREASYKVGPLSYDLKSRAELWNTKAEKWRAEAEGETSSPSGGMTEADQGTPYFTTGMHDNI